MAPGGNGQNATILSSYSSSGSILDTASLFTERDLEQEADLTGAQTITLSSNNDVTITEEGVYVLTGTAENVTVTVNADDSSKVQIVLDGVTITNSSAPAIYVASADKVFVTTASGSENALGVTGSFAYSADENADGVIFAKDDLVMNGTGTLTITSSDNGIVGKDEVKVTGGTYNITAEGHGIQGKDSVAIADGTFTISAGTDAIHAENADDLTLGYAYIGGGTFTLSAASDGIGAYSAVQIDDGKLTINSAEGIEGTYVQINGGTIDITASDDGINATTKSSAYDVTLEITGGNLSVNMGQGDTDALDSNGNLYICGGTISITGQSAFDFDGEGALVNATLTVNGEQVTELSNSMMGGMGGMGGQPGAMSGQAPTGSSNATGSQGAPNGMSGKGGKSGGMR